MDEAKKLLKLQSQMGIGLTYNMGRPLYTINMSEGVCSIEGKHTTGEAREAGEEYKIVEVCIIEGPHTIKETRKSEAAHSMGG